MKSSILAGILALSSMAAVGQSDEFKAVPQPILEVVNQHLTIGLRIPSAYVTVFSDGTVECHTLKVDGREADVVKRRVLTGSELANVKAAITDDDLSHVDKKYWLTRSVADSWMEWHIRIPRKLGPEEIVIANFLPLSQRTYPRSVMRLGCLISRLRDEVYGDGFENKQCTVVLDTK